MNKIFCFVILLGLISCGNKETPTAETDTRAQVKKAATVANNNTNTRKKPVAQTVAAGEYKAKNEGWLINLDEAFNESKKTGKPIMANFTGSDWCGWCKRLDKSVFHQPGFEKWAKENVVLLELDFPRRFKLPADVAAQNRNMQQSLGVRGYPTIWVFDMDKDAAGKYNINPLGKTGYTKTIGEFQNTIEKYISARNS